LRHSKENENGKAIFLSVHIVVETITFVKWLTSLPSSIMENYHVSNEAKDEITLHGGHL